MPKPKSHSKSRSQPKSVVRKNKSAQQGLLPRRQPVIVAKAADAAQVVASPSSEQNGAPTTDFTRANRSSEEDASARVAFAHCLVNWPVEEDEATALDESETNQARARDEAGTDEAKRPMILVKATTGVAAQPGSSVEPNANAVVQPTTSVAREVVQPIPSEIVPPNASVAPVSAPQAEPARVGVPAESHRVQLPKSVLPIQVVRDAQAHRGQAGPRATGWKWQAWIGAGLGALLLVAGGAVAGAYSHFASGNSIAPDVFIAGVPVGGLTKAQAQQRLAKHLGSPRVALGCGGKTVQLPLSQLGASPAIVPVVKQAYAIGRGGNLPSNLMHVYGQSGEGKQLGLWLAWNPAKLKNALEKVNSRVALAPVDARLRAGNDGLEVVPDHVGRAVDLDAAQKLVRRRVRLGAYSLEVPMRPINAKVTARSLDGHDVQLAGYTTQFNSGLAGRTENIRIACRAIQNRVLMPGETFSFNSCTGQRTARKGYQMAHIFLRQPGADEPEVVEGLAGGVCQVSSTLFNAVRKTNAKARINPIKVVERSTHSLPVTYVPPGLDATVAWPDRDLKFRNVTNHPVYVRAQMGRSKLSISIWGRVPRA